MDRDHYAAQEPTGNVLVQRAVAAMGEDPFEYTGGKPMQWPRHWIETALFEIAAQGGNVRRAHGVLLGIHGDAAPPYDTMQRWRKGRFRNLYTEISRVAGEELRERIAQNATELALEFGDVEREALRRIRAGLGDADAVEASMILRNLSTSKGINLDHEGKLRGRSQHVVQVQGLEQITDALKRLGVAQEVVVDAEVVG